jgi:aryl-phospho-beta-D-glucosidase BglC (GH1 family)
MRQKLLWPKRLIILSGMIFSLSARAQLPTAQQIVSQMTIGWNMGNTLEAICGETAWGGAITTQALIDSVKAAGFNTVRLPCAWFCHSDTLTSTIDETWIARVGEVVDYCIKDSLYVIINIHWDKGWLENRVNEANQYEVNQRQQAYWTQIANYFKDYDEHLLFASANEPNVEDAAGMAILLSYHQTFIDAVRATGGNNSSRTLIIQGPSTDIEKTYNLMNTLPTDQIADRLIVEVHYYTPYQFTLMTEDASWGKMFYYWGKNYHSTTDVSRNATWGEESDVEKYFRYMKTKFIDKGIPVIIGEFSANKRNLTPPSDESLHIASRNYFYKYIVKSAKSKGMIPYCWDINNQLFDRSTGKILDTAILRAMKEGAEEANTAITVKMNNNTLKLYPNPFFSKINIQIDNPDKILRISIFDVMGNQLETLERSSLSKTITMGNTLKPDVYIVQIYGDNWTQSFKVVKMNL